MTITQTPSRFASLLTRPGPRLAGLGLLFLVLLIPLSMIESRVNERGLRRDEAASNVAQSWGHAQSIAGPILRLPYRVVTIERDGAKTWEKVHTGWLLLPPQRLDADAMLDAEVRKRGIFEVPVYRAALKLRGEFRLPDISGLAVSLDDVDFTRAELLLGISSPGSLSAGSKVLLDGKALALEPSALTLGAQGVHAGLASGVPRTRLEQGIPFDIDMALNGSSGFHLAPVARETTLELRSNWPHPSFNGQGLPTRSAISEQGFSASWSMSHLGRGYPGAWLDGEVPREQIDGSAFGVSLFASVDPYRMAERIAKYGALLLLLSFAVIWVMELLGGKPLHAVQYLLLGGSLCLFGLLQLALAEHLGFAAAFLLAAFAVVAQATWYAHTATGSARRAFTLGALLSGWFAYLYAVLQAEDLAFLLGALALFAALTAVMWATRKVNWATGRAVPERWDVADATIE
jgi:inner membrane protein